MNILGIALAQISKKVDKVLAQVGSLVKEPLLRKVVKKPLANSNWNSACFPSFNI